MPLYNSILFNKLGQYFVLPSVLFTFGLGFSMHTVAATYGTFEPRALAMGGVGVAVGNAEQAIYYNPALLSFSDGKEEDTRNGRFYFPSFLLQATRNIEDGIDIIEDDLDVQITNAVNTFNADSSQANAISLLTAARDIESAVSAIGNEEANLEAVIGFNISEPGDHEGGGFYFASRILGFAQSDVPQEDSDLLTDYVDVLELIADGDTVTAAATYPELFDGTTLIDPSDSLTSSADVGSLIIAEWGVAAAKEFNVFNKDISFGITPKVQHIQVFREQVFYNDADIDYQEDSRTFFTMNVDLGVATTLGDNFRIGLAVKDVLSQSFISDSGLAVEIKPKVRFGSAYFHKYVTVGFDIDVIANPSVTSETPIQEASLGVEITPWKGVNLRVGYQHEFTGVYGDVLTTGAAIQWRRFMTDFSFITGSEKLGVSFQMGYAF